MKLAVVGLGKMGLSLAGCFARKGFDVTGVDVSPQVVQAVNAGRAPFFEPGLDDLLRASSERLVATHDLEKAVSNSSATFILVPSPVNDSGALGTEILLDVAEGLGRALKEEDEFHLVAVMSTATPGTMEGVIIPTLEACSGKLCGKDFGLCYSPVLVALGSVIRDIFEPDLVLAGESDPHSGEMLTSIYDRLCENRPRFARMSLVDAEIAKLAINSYLATKVSFANFLARVCQEVPGANVDAVTAGLGLDGRIGGKYLTGAISFGGPCLPRDNQALSRFAESLGVTATLPAAASLENSESFRSLIRLIESHLPEGGTVGFLGLAFKPDTHVIEDSPGILAAEDLSAKGTRVIAYDPVALDNARSHLGDRIEYGSTAEDVVERADVVVVTTPWNEFAHIEPRAFERSGTPRVVVDCWRALDAAKLAEVTLYIPLGVGAH